MAEARADARGRERGAELRAVREVRQARHAPRTLDTITIAARRANERRRHPQRELVSRAHDRGARELAANGALEVLGRDVRSRPRAARAPASSFAIAARSGRVVRSLS